MNGVKEDSPAGDRTAPTPDVEASTPTMKGFCGSGWTRSGADVKAEVASGVQDRDLGLPFRRLVNGRARERSLIC